MAVGIVGALIGSWLMPRSGIHIASGVLSAIIVATIGAVLLLVIVRLVTLACLSAPSLALLTLEEINKIARLMAAHPALLADAD